MMEELGYCNVVICKGKSFWGFGNYIVPYSDFHKVLWNSLFNGKEIILWQYGNSLYCRTFG